MPQTVLLTGISGFIGLYCAKELLDSGFTVRGTIRSKLKEQAVCDTMKSNNVNIENLESTTFQK